MIKLKISYEHEEDLARILTVLRPMIIRCKRSGNTQGRYKKAYVELEHVMKSGESREENGLKQGRSRGKHEKEISESNPEQRTKPGGTTGNGKKGRY